MTKTPPTIQPTFAWLWQRPVCFVAFGFGTGLAPKAPGTFGTLPALFISGLLLGSGMSKLALGLLCLPLFALGIWICNQAEQALGTHDYSGIVWDEIVAMMLVLACIPQGLGWWSLAFIVFRLFDAIKPPPIRWFDQKVHGGLGVMLDDIIAAIMTIIVLHIIIWIS